MPHYKVSYKNGQYRIIEANSLEEARGKARANLRKQRGYEHSVGYGGPGDPNTRHPVHASIETVKPYNR